MKAWAALIALVAAACGGEGVAPPRPPFTGVALDPRNKDGVHFEIPPFDVPAGQEVQDCYFLEAPDVNNGQDYFVDRIRVGMNPGSHHLTIFRVRTVTGLGTVEQGSVVQGGEC